VACLLLLLLGFESSCARLSPPRCLTCPLGLQDVQWVVGLVVVRTSWPGHPRKSKKKKKTGRKCNIRLIRCNIRLIRCVFVSKARRGCVYNCYKNYFLSKKKYIKKIYFQHIKIIKKHKTIKIKNTIKPHKQTVPRILAWNLQFCLVLKKQKLITDHDGLMTHWF
jgi:hypothetical protein